MTQTPVASPRARRAAIVVIAALLLVCPALSLHAAEVADPVAQAIERADGYNQDNHFAKSIRLLESFESLKRPDLDFALAYALYSDAVNGAVEADAGRADVSRALALAERSAATGNGYALNLLFLMHNSGVGMPVDADKAFTYLKRAVAAGDVGAKINYSVRLYGGGTPLGRDRNAACALFTELQALPDPDPVSGYYLGQAHFWGECGFTADRAKGVALIEAAARSEVREAQADMGKNFEYGWLGEKDIKQALAWYQLAADLGEPYAQWRIGMAFVNGDQRDLDPAQAVAWFQRSAAMEHPMGLTSLAVMVATGDGIAQDFAEARSLYARGAAAGNPHAYRGLAVMHLLGEGGAPDPARARVLYWQAVNAGNPEEPTLLADIEGRMGTKHREQAKREIEALGGQYEPRDKNRK